MTNTPPSFCLLGASDDTGNLGVSALAYATLTATRRASPAMTATVFDHGWGVRGGSVRAADQSVEFRRIGLRRSRRIHRRESYWNTRWSARLGGLGNPAAVALREATAVLDISGGDSFTDLYGDHRFAMMVEPKELCLELGTPLVLLPQTYGPFSSDRSRGRVRRVMAGVNQAWSRDADSHAALIDLAGDVVDPSRLHQGVDVAFALPRADRSALDRDLVDWMDAEPVAGFNISGLVLADTDGRRFDLRYDYRAVVTEIISRLTDDVPVLLIPHVLGASADDVDSDPAALAEIHGSLPPKVARRVRIAPSYDDPQVVKALIARLAWFCGTRMHATIAALSSGIPSAALAYSAKTRGVFATCGQADHVATPADSTADAVERIWASWQHRESLLRSLATAAPEVVKRSTDQFEQMLAGIPGGGGPR